MILRKSPEKYGYACIARFSCFSLTRSVMALPSKIAREVWLCMYCSIFMLLSDTECHGASNGNTELRAIASNFQPDFRTARLIPSNLHPIYHKPLPIWDISIECGT